jgi:hypothetical protein
VSASTPRNTPPVVPSEIVVWASADSLILTSACTDACLNEFDEAVGTIIGALRRLRLYDNTLIWFTT